MAVFTGSLADFEKFIGPATNRIVTKLGKELKKSQKTCQNNVLGEHTTVAEYCGKYKSLDSAHFSHKKLDRKSIIKNILNVNFKNGNSYSVDLNTFLHHYEEAHKPLKDNLIMLCRQHHRAYDKKHKVKNEYYEENDIDTEMKADKDITKSDVKQLKNKLIDSLDYLKNANSKIARISGEQWNFNIGIEEKKGYLLCLNQFDWTITVLKYDFSVYQIGNLKKDGNKISLLIPFSESAFRDKFTAYQYEMVENINLH